jgi:hypothetical protein
MSDSKLRFGFGFGLAIAIAATGCPADDTGGADGEGSGTEGTSNVTDTMTGGMSMTGASMSASMSMTGATTGEPTECLGVGGPGEVGASCMSNDDCMSGVCLAFQDVPVDPDAVCGEEPADCATHVTATLFDFSAVVETGVPAPLGGAEVRVLKALEAITNPAGATPIASATPGGDGRVDIVTDGAINAAIAIIAVAGGGDYFLTATGVGSEVENGRYTVGTGIHEFWTVSTATLEEWTTALMDDTDAAEALGDGLGTSGGVIGFVRDGEGAPVMGATVASDSDTSGAIIRYPQEDGTMGTEGTGPNGTFVILGPTPTGEDFTAMAGGMTGGGTAGSANNVVFTLILTVG